MNEPIRVTNTSLKALLREKSSLVATAAAEVFQPNDHPVCERREQIAAIMVRARAMYRDLKDAGKLAPVESFRRVPGGSSVENWLMEDKARESATAPDLRKRFGGVPVARVAYGGGYFTGDMPIDYEFARARPEEAVHTQRRARLDVYTARQLQIREGADGTPVLYRQDIPGLEEYLPDCYLALPGEEVEAIK